MVLYLEFQHYSVNLARLCIVIRYSNSLVLKHDKKLKVYRQFIAYKVNEKITNGSREH